MHHSEAPPPKQGPRIGFAAAFGLGIVPVALLLVVHGRAGVPDAAPPVADAAAERPAAPPVAVSSEGAPSPSAVDRAPGTSAASRLERPATEDDYFRTLEELRRTVPGEALAWVERGDEWYGTEGPRAEARTAMKVTLLVDLDRMSEARVVTRRFIAEHPDSQYRPLVQGITGIHPRPGPPASVASRRH